VARELRAGTVETVAQPSRGWGPPAGLRRPRRPGRHGRRSRPTARDPASPRRPARYGPAVHVIRGLRQALVLLVGAAVVAVAAAGVWWALADGALRPKVALSLFVVAGLLALLGGSAVSRAETSDIRAFLGMGPEADQPDLTPALGPVGVFLFVSLPLAVAGLVLAG
jgi:hypothetical protein